jgi:hypothetical protein
MAMEKIVVMQNDVIPIGSTVVYDRGKDTLMVLTKIADDGVEGEWTSESGDTFVISDRRMNNPKVREFAGLKDLKLKEETLSQKYAHDIECPSGDVIGFEFDSSEERDIFREKLNRLLKIHRESILQELRGRLDEIEAVEIRL